MAPDGSAVNDEKSRIDRYPYKTIGFDVHKINRDAEEEEEGLSYLEDSLDGLAMFVGLNHSFAVSATAANGLQPNSIYFTDERLLSPSGWRDDVNYGGHDIGIFDYQNKTISPCYYPCDVQSFKRIIPAPIWFTPTLPA
ncbi:hypothetical protein PHJA_001045700 [Phtheirospermum japonicum]|uniref:KIB1-4 beta-propeller domain-containing protein n=1 Tax=Phtheirospermum japonicum TaxID=374723 RepID=A0A830BN87_9LAMI|nr:hypothetical protein PHJA_001045700 [Phtheirospermum japonicum]